MPITLQADDTNEFFHDTDYELLGNQGTYGVITGCAVTYDAADMTFDIAAGTILHNGVAVAVAAQANADTIVADSSNERWWYIALDSAGSSSSVQGDAAADASTEPTKPEVGDRVLLAMVKVEAAQTVANNIATKLDKRVMLRGPFTIIKAADETVNSTTTLQDDDELLFPVAASTTYAFEAFIVYNSGTTPDYKGAFTVPAGSTITWVAHYIQSGGAVVVQTTVNASATAIQGEGAASNNSFIAKGFVTTSTTAGNLTYQFAQVTSDAGNTTTKAGSWLRVALDDAS